MSTHRAAALVVAVACAACAPPRLKLPEGPGTTLPDYSTVLDTATARCRAIRTLSAEIGLSGRAAGQRLRGRALIGLEAPSSVRLEGVAPFGTPLFILVSRDNRATLLLPRENRVLEGQPPESVLDALAGLDLSPAALLAILSSCVPSASPAVDGRLHGKWAAIRLADGTTVWLDDGGGARRVRALARGDLCVEYGEPGRSGSIHIRVSRTRTDGRDVDLSLVLSQVETNTSMDAATFTVVVPADAEPLSLEQVRREGPLGASTSPTTK